MKLFLFFSKIASRNMTLSFVTIVMLPRAFLLPLEVKIAVWYSNNC